MTRAALALVAAVLLAPATASAARLPGPPVALAAGAGGAYAVVATRSRNVPFRLVDGTGRGLGAFGSRGAEFADVAVGDAGPVVVSARPTSTGFAYESALATSGGFAERALLGEGTGPPVLVLEGATRLAAYPDEDGDLALGADKRSRDGPLVRHAPRDAVSGELVLDVAQSRTRTELRVRGPGAPTQAIATLRGRRAVEATIARDETRLYVAYRIGNRLALASAAARLDARWRRRRLRTRGTLQGVPAVARVGLRTIIVTSQRRRRRRSLYLTTAGPAGTFLDRLTRARAADLSPLVAQTSDGRVYVAWSRRATGRARRTGLLRRLL